MLRINPESAHAERLQPNFSHRIRVFYQRLLKRGKTQMVALVAAMRKLLVILNVMARTRQPWRTDPTPT